MNVHTRSERRRPAWLPALLLGAALAVAACGPDENAAAPDPTPPPATAPAVTAETGGMSLSGAQEGTPAGEAQADPAAAVSDATASAAGRTGESAAGASGDQAALPALAPGAVITAAAPIAVYADADPSAPRFAEYTEGTVFAVIEPGGDYTTYPVEVDGRRWYRVRAPDGLVGWVAES